ncbi:MAG: presenilin family intramembrane aspartyl protease [Candidatus Staskawiczbacteria bacterium]|nr:presenilin family intramembrane aspartyl protease [Candidatus Staskawiczbacteria bacterium]
MKYKLPKIIRDKKNKAENQKQFWKVFLIEGGLFLLTSVLSVVSAFKLDKLAQAQKIYLPQNSLQDFLFSFLFVMFFVLIFALYNNKKINKFKEVIYKGIFIITVFWGGMTVLNLFMPVFVAILIMGILMALWLEAPSVWVHDVLVILGLAGAAGFFGLGFAPAVVVALLLIFSVYDFVAVYKTKHMVAMLKEMIEKKVILGFIIPKAFRFFSSNLKEIKRPEKYSENFMILGGGDVVFPSLLAVSVIPFGFSKSLIIALFSLFGLFFSYYIFMKEKEPIPALPPIALFSIMGYLATLFF